MATTLAKPKQQKEQDLSHTPNYITILPPGRVIAEKMREMGIDSAELARRMHVSVDSIEKLLRFEIPLTESMAKKLEKATWMDAELMMRFELAWRKNLAYAMKHPEIPAYLGDEIVNQPQS